MRTREEIIKDVRKPEDFGGGTVNTEPLPVEIELLLDIRDLLANPEIQKDFGKARDLLTKN